jgi:hypothetical protein
MLILKGEIILIIIFYLNKALIIKYITYLKLKRNKKDKYYKSKLAF